MKARFEFDSNEDYQEYLFTYFTAQIVSGYVSNQNNYKGDQKEIVQFATDLAKKTVAKVRLTKSNLF